MILIHVETDGLRAKANVGYIHQSQSQTNTHKQKSSPDFRTNGLVIFTVSIMIYFLLLVIAKTEIYCKSTVKVILPVPGRLRQES